ncbi:hypothetical protein XENORESO_007714 [Xenotaenia resolanae]|uniref:Uncharacterized protein n=1 Tax=Xenotaenia resolanae TaxID=208358 RepID=A0ABV0X2M4_9TELE
MLKAETLRSGSHRQINGPGFHRSSLICKKFHSEMKHGQKMFPETWNGLESNRKRRKNHPNVFVDAVFCLMHLMNGENIPRLDLQPGAQRRSQVDHQPVNQYLKPPKFLNV